MPEQRCFRAKEDTKARQSPSPHLDLGGEGPMDKEFMNSARIWDK